MGLEDYRKHTSPASRRWAIWVIGGVILIILIVWAVQSWKNKNQPHQQVLKMGAILPQTGPGAVFASYIKDGIDLAVEEVNAGAYPHMTVLYEDSKNQPKEAVTVYNKLVSTQSPAVIIVALSSVAKALAPLAAESGTAQVYVAVAIPDITDGKYTFRIYPEASGMAGVMARFNIDHMQAKTSAVVYINDDFGRVSLDAYKKEVESHGGSVIFSESYELQQTDFRSLISKLNAVSPAPNVIYLSGYGPSYGVFVRQLKEQGVSSQLTADMTMGLPSTLEQAGPAAENIYFVDGKVSSEFTQRFIRKYGRSPSSYAGYAYDITKLVYRTSITEHAFTADSVRAGLVEVSNYPGAMGNITITPKGDSNLQFVVKRVQGTATPVVAP